MADLPTLTLGAFVAGSSVSTATTGTPPVLQSIATADDATNVHDTNNATHTGVAVFELGDTPTDFGTMDTLSIRVRFAIQSGARVNTWDLLTGQVVAADGTTPLTAERTLAIDIINTTPTNTTVLAFSSLNTSADKATWDGALVILRFSVTRDMGGDALEERVLAAELTGTYSAGALEFTGTLSVTEAADGLAATGTFTPPTITGGLAITEAADALAAAGSFTPPGFTGTLAVAEAADALAAAGTADPPTFTGSLAATEATDTLAAAGEVTNAGITGTLGITEASDTLAGSGTVAAPVFSGDLVAVEADDTLAAAGASAAPVFTGDMAAIESPDTLAATGEVSSDAIVGTVAVTEATDTLAAAGTFTVGPTTGAVSVTEETDLLAAAGTSTTPVFTGTLATTEAAGVLAAAGTFSPGSRQGTGVYSEAADTLAAVGTFTPVPTATGSVSMLPGRASMATTLAPRYATAVLAVSRVPTSGGVT